MTLSKNCDRGFVVTRCVSPDFLCVKLNNQFLFFFPHPTLLRGKIQYLDQKCCAHGGAPSDFFLIAIVGRASEGPSFLDFNSKDIFLLFLLGFNHVHTEDTIASFGMNLKLSFQVEAGSLSLLTCSS